MKTTLSIAIGFLAMTLALAAKANCELVLTMNMTYKGEQMAKSVVTYTGLEASDLALLKDKAMNVVKAAAQAQEKGGDYNLTLSRAESCDGKAGAMTPDLEMAGVKTAGVAKVFRAMNKEGEALLKIAETDAAKGKAKAWGKDKK